MRGISEAVLRGLVSADGRKSQQEAARTSALGCWTKKRCTEARRVARRRGESWEEDPGTEERRPKQRLRTTVRTLEKRSLNTKASDTGQEPVKTCRSHQLVSALASAINTPRTAPLDLRVDSSEGPVR